MQDVCSGRYLGSIPVEAEKEIRVVRDRLCINLVEPMGVFEN